MKRVVVIVAISITSALLVVPSLANARAAGRTFAQTYPAASKLCDKADANTLGAQLTPSRDQVLAACSTLKTSFSTAQSTYKTTTDPLTARAKAAVASVKAACAGASSDASAGGGEGKRGSRGGSAECRAARRAARTELKAVRTAAKAARKTYITAVQAGRKTFWTAIKALKGGDTLPTDTSTSTGSATPAKPVIPADSTVAA